MTRATITPQPGGRAEFTWRGIDHTFASTAEAMDQARRRGIDFEVARFPAPPFVLAESPALTATP